MDDITDSTLGRASRPTPCAEGPATKSTGTTWRRKSKPWAAANAAKCAQD